MPSLVVQTSFIGDVILTTPLIARVAQRDVVHVLTTPAGAAVLANNPDIRSLIVYDKRRSGIRGFWRAVGEAIGGGTAYLAQGSVRSAVIALLAGYRERIGFNTSTGRVLYTTRVTYRDDWHHARRLLSLADPTMAAVRALGAENHPALRPRLFPGTDDVAAVNTLLENRVASARPLVVLAPGSVWATKRWPYYAELASALTNEVDLAIVGGPEDTELARAIVERVGAERVIDAVGHLSILGSAELIRRAAIIVTNDSSPQHLASAMGTPTVTIFGPTVPSFGFGPLAPGSRVLGRDTLVCRPCDRHGPARCPLGHWSCMRDITVHDVRAAVLDVLYQSEPIRGSVTDR